MRAFALAVGLTMAGLTATPAAAADKLTVLLEWFVNPDHAPLIIAEQLGMFQKAGLDVALVPPTDPSAPPRLIAAKQADVAIHYEPSLFLDVDAGLPLVRFGSLVETPLNTLTVLESGPIQKLSDLRGKRIGFSVAGFEDALLQTMLSSAGLSKSDVELVNVNFSLSPALISGRVDATIGGYRNFELTQMRQEGHAGRAFYPEEHGVPPYEELIFVTHRDLASDNRLPRFLAAVEQAALYITNHPQDAWQLFIKAYPDLNNDLNKQAFFDTIPRFAKRPGAIDLGAYQRFGTFLKQQGLIKTVPAVGQIAVSVR